MIEDSGHMLPPIEREEEAEPIEMHYFPPQPVNLQLTQDQFRILDKVGRLYFRANQAGSQGKK